MNKKLDQNTKWSQLMQASLSGDKVAYNQLLKEVYPVIVKFLQMRIKDEAMSEDLAQEVLISIHKARHTYDPVRSFSNWLFAIAKYKMIDYLRKAKRTSFKEVMDDEFLMNLAEIEEDSNLEVIKDRVHSALLKLPAKQQMIVQKLKIEGLSVHELSAEINMSESAVKVAAHRAYKIMKQDLMGEVL